MQRGLQGTGPQAARRAAHRALDEAHLVIEEDPVVDLAAPSRERRQVPDQEDRLRGTRRRTSPVRSRRGSGTLRHRRTRARDPRPSCARPPAGRPRSPGRPRSRRRAMPHRRIATRSPGAGVQASARDPRHSMRPRVRGSAATTAAPSGSPRRVPARQASERPAITSALMYWARRAVNRPAMAGRGSGIADPGGLRRAIAAGSRASPGAVTWTPTAGRSGRSTSRVAVRERLPVGSVVAADRSLGRMERRGSHPTPGRGVPGGALAIRRCGIARTPRPWTSGRSTVALPADVRTTAEDRGLEFVEGAAARHCRVAIDGTTFVAAFPQAVLPGRRPAAALAVARRGRTTGSSSTTRWACSKAR